MKYLFYEKETDTRAKIMLIYSVVPPQELLNKGNYIKIESIEEPEQKEGKSALPYCNPQTNEFWYEYVDRPLSEEEITNVKLKEQEQAIAELSAIVATMGGAK